MTKEKLQEFQTISKARSQRLRALLEESEISCGQLADEIKEAIKDIFDGNVAVENGLIRLKFFNGQVFTVSVKEAKDED